ncbi:hypothetical protein SADUNF_Sadunf16G0102500 [Salix dunnii]|uniref:Uncharacterized protein n=1 Tax=Salix dunnii TaxID=1413687 RepID=A0A835JDH5_9ROSI|nr:hypothetical protein SADUNF_Sadunf16G0102500 [Salix dunnii]
MRASVDICNKKFSFINYSSNGARSYWIKDHQWEAIEHQLPIRWSSKIAAGQANCQWRTQQEIMRLIKPSRGSGYKSQSGEWVEWGHRRKNYGSTCATLNNLGTNNEVFPMSCMVVSVC